MRKILIAIALLVSAISYAYNLECVGNAVLLENDGDTLFVFEKNPELRAKSCMGKDTNLTWYSYPDTTRIIQYASNYLDGYNGLEHSQGYAIKINGQWQKFWVFDFESLRAQFLDVQQTCTNTDLLVALPEFKYLSTNGVYEYPERLCRVAYLDAEWKENQWGDSLAIVEQPLLSTVSVPASPVLTYYTLTDILAERLSLNDTIANVQVHPLAVKAHPQAIVTTRPKEKSNEVDRPIDPETLIRRSAPLEVEFIANGLNTDYYLWNMYKGTTKILQRAEPQHRYVFTEPGNYRVVLGANNGDGCSIDSVVFDIQVSESMLQVPNVFTPNGDGTNDEFRVVYRSLKEFHCWVYNRWGHLVYEWNDPAKGWDGTIHGKPAAEGAYYYVIRALGTDAQSSYISKASYTKKLKKGEQPLGVWQLSGHINLLR